jgi:peroxiredoxin Q/BCP
MSKEPIADLELPATGGQPFSMKDHQNHPLVIYFYPKDNTPGCTTEATQFRDLHKEFTKSGAQIFGVSRDSLKSHDNFKAKFSLPFELISDPEETACALFNVIKMKNMYGKQVRGIERSTFVFDGKGKLVKEWRGVKVPGHVQEVLDFIRSL